MHRHPVSPTGVLLLYFFGLFKVSKMTVFNFDLFQVSKMTVLVVTCSKSAIVLKNRATQETLKAQFENFRC